MMAFTIGGFPLIGSKIKKPWNWIPESDPRSTVIDLRWLLRFTFNLELCSMYSVIHRLFDIKMTS